MPRRADPELERRILDAAQKLWKKGGEKALTMRTVARAAGTNTPAVYRRFRDRDDILRGLLQRIRWEIAAQLEGISSPEEGCERYLDYALSHPREYELFFQKEYELFHSARSLRAGVKVGARPVRDVMRQKVAEKLGGSPDDHQRVLMALQMVVHGAAMLLIEKAILPENAAEARAVLTASVAALLRAGDALRG
ncbi:MAG: TetR/AcrR family transcriptional regulator [Candidatus Sulfotelmatobacter sp.]